MGKHRTPEPPAGDVMTMPDFINHLETTGSPLAPTIRASYNAATDAIKAELEQQMRPVLERITQELHGHG